MCGGGIVYEEVAFVVVEIEHLVGEVADDEALPTGAVVVCGINPHCAGRDTTFVISNSGEHSGFNEGAVAVILIEFIGLGIICLKDIRQTVGIVVEDANAERFACTVLNPCNTGDIQKCAVAAVPEEFAGLTGVGFRGTIRLICAVKGTEYVVLYSPLDIVRYINVEVSVFVVVEPCATRTEAGVMDTGGFGDINESAVTTVLEEAIGLKGADIDIWVTVVIVIGDSDSHAVEWDSESCGFGDIGESAVLVVAIECHRLPLLGWLTPPILSVDEENVLPTVGVIIEEGAAGPHGFGEVFFPVSTCIMDEVDSGFARDVGELGQGLCRSS